MELDDDQPILPDLGGRALPVAAVEPLDVDGVRTVEVGTGLFFLAFVALLPFYGRLHDDGRTWLLWTCLAGAGLGLFGLEYCRRRRRLRTELAAARGSVSTPDTPSASDAL